MSEETTQEVEETQEEDQGPVPYDRFKEVNDEKRLLKEQLEEVKSATEEELNELKEQARVAQEAAEALAARDNISKEEALKSIQEESNKMREKYAPQIADSQTKDTLSALQQKVDQMDLLSAYPDAREHLDLIKDVSRSTGKSMLEVYENRLKDKLGGDMATKQEKQAQSYSPSGRHVDADTPKSSEKQRQQLRENWKAAREAGDIHATEKAAHAIVKERLRDLGHF